MNAEILPVLEEISAVLKKHDMTGLFIVGKQDALRLSYRDRGELELRENGRVAGRRLRAADPREEGGFSECGGAPGLPGTYGR